jgi:hypothetical protein
VRIEALVTIKSAFEAGFAFDDNSSHGMLASILSLSAEKLDRVRLSAFACLHTTWPVFDQVRGTYPYIPDFPPRNSGASQKLETSSPAYFLHILSLFHVPWARQGLLRGFVTSAGAGSEGLLKAAREALVVLLEAFPAHRRELFLKEYVTFLGENLSNERLIVPCLDTLAFVLDTGLTSACVKDDPKLWSKMFALVQKAHYKSGNVTKLLAAVNVYGGLARIDGVRKDVLVKLASMLLHPYPNVRVAVAETLYTVGIESACARLEKVDWTRTPKELRASVADIQKGIKASKET